MDNKWPLPFVLRETFFYTMVCCGENFKLPFALTVKGKEITRFEGLPQFKWNNLGKQDAIGQGCFDAVFVTRDTKNEDCSDSSSVESFVTEKKLLLGKKCFVIKKKKKMFVDRANVVDS